VSHLQIIGRSSSHFTRVTLIFAYELEVPFEFVPVYDLTTMEPTWYEGNPALKIPSLRRNESFLFGTENICRSLAEASNSKKRVIWPEELPQDISRNAQELVWHSMTAQVQLIVGIMIGKLPADHIFFTKIRAGFEGALRWLDDNLSGVLQALPPERDLSLFEVTLFCLIEHLSFRVTLPRESYPVLVRFANEFGARTSAQRTMYRFDTTPVTS
jgi:glutathione S-transferase